MYYIIRRNAGIILIYHPFYLAQTDTALPIHQSGDEGKCLGSYFYICVITPIVILSELAISLWCIYSLPDLIRVANESSGGCTP